MAFMKIIWLLSIVFEWFQSGNSVTSQLCQSKQNITQSRNWAGELRRATPSTSSVVNILFLKSENWNHQVKSRKANFVCVAFLRSILLLVCQKKWKEQENFFRKLIKSLRRKKTEFQRKLYLTPPTEIWLEGPSSPRLGLKTWRPIK